MALSVFSWLETQATLSCRQRCDGQLIETKSYVPSLWEKELLPDTKCLTVNIRTTQSKKLYSIFRLLLLKQQYVTSNCWGVLSRVLRWKFPIIKSDCAQVLRRSKNKVEGVNPGQSVSVSGAWWASGVGLQAIGKNNNEAQIIKEFRRLNISSNRTHIQVYCHMYTGIAAKLPQRYVDILMSYISRPIAGNILDSPTEVSRGLYLMCPMSSNMS